MKKRILITLGILLLAILTFTAFSCGNTENAATTDSTSAEEPPSDTFFYLTENGKPAYIILRRESEDCPEQDETGSRILKETLKSKFGFDFRTVSDYEDEKLGISGRREKEIVIGVCNGIEDRSGELGEFDFLIKPYGHKILIQATNNYSMTKAIQKFCSMIEKTREGDIMIELGREILHHNELDGLYFDVEDKTDLIGICYSTWFNPIIDGAKKVNGVPQPSDITKILNGEQDWGGIYEFHYWGEPALGYYRSDDKEVIRTHMTQIAEAGIDYIIIDNTNAQLAWQSSSYWNDMVDEPCTVLLDTIVEMRKEGLKTPYVVMWCSTANGWDVVDYLYDEFYTKDKYSTCFVYWSGKPFFLTNTDPAEKRNNITYRRQWGLLTKEETRSCWSFLNREPDYVTYGSDGKPEQCCVNAAHQATYMSLADTATGRRGGLTMWECWENAFRYHPKFITITWWNEWAAQRFEGNKFVDNYNQEYSRDIEPMKGGHGDTYYQWTKQYIAAYKAGEPCPKLVEK